MNFWKVKPSKAAGGFFIERERTKDGKPDGVDHGDVYYKRYGDAERSVTIKNDGMLKHRDMVREKERMQNA